MSCRQTAWFKTKTLMLYRLAWSEVLKKVSAHVDAKEITISDDMEIMKEPLPRGQYLYRFVVRDVFGNRIDSGKLMPVNWDRRKVSYPAEEKKEGQ